MRRKFLVLTGLAVTLLMCTSAVEAHLCNDVFAQAQDNLAVKVDVRDGQLRISEEASFRVYLLNTMDRNIVSIKLEVVSEEFKAEVTPSSDWDNYPSLKTTNKGGEKVYFDVKLKRKPDVPDGRYEIGLRLYNGRNRDQIFKTVDLESAAGAHRLENKSQIQVDGDINREEWGDAYLCTGFFEYIKKGRYFENRKAEHQPRFRVSASEKYLYGMLGFVGGKDAEKDVATLYVASSSDAEPVKVQFDRIRGNVECEGDASRIKIAKSEQSRGEVLECRIPRDMLGIEDTDEFYVNFSRSVRKNGEEQVSYWRGNKFSVTNPVVYDKFVQAW